MGFEVFDEERAISQPLDFIDIQKSGIFQILISKKLGWEGMGKVVLRGE